MLKRWMIVVFVIAAIAAIAVLSWPKGQQAPVSSATVIATTTAETKTPSVSPRASATPSAPIKTPSATHAPKATPTNADDPTASWAPAVDCVPGDIDNLENSHLGRCTVKGKTPLQVLDTCRTAARQWMSRISGGTAGGTVSTKESARRANVAICLEGFGLKSIESSNVEGCPLKCSHQDSRDGLQYILLTGGILSEDGYNELPVLFNAATGVIVQDGAKDRDLNVWESQFGG